ncbi:MAG: aminopeptidase [Caldilineaceae bacterium]|nr:aminopeptidase [Caldilineaceae bacterium]
MDKRWQALGELIVNYSVAVKPGEKVMIAMGEVETLPLVQAVYAACIQAGALPQVQFLSETLRHALLKYGNQAQLTWLPAIEAYGMAWADVYIGLRGAHNLYELADIPTERLTLNQRAQGKISTLRWQQTRWCLLRVPNAAFAQQAETDLATITDMFFDACLLDWPREVATWQRWARRLEQGREIHIVGKGTDLRFSVAGRQWVVGDGKLNLPDGEIMTAPHPETIDGEIYFEFPGVLSGRLMHDIRLRWQQGKLVEATASTNQEFLQAIVQSDAGASLIGEFAFGVNAQVTHFCKDILIDEKIGGTVHLALGRAYPETGGTNQSAIHWDIIKDTRQEGTVYLDGEPILARGKFLFD